MHPDERRRVVPLAPPEIERVPPPPLRVALLVAALGLATLIVVALGAPQPPQSTNALTEGAITTIQLAAATDLSRLDWWEHIPDDFDYLVYGRPGSGEPMFAGVSGVTLVYVNSLGRATVVDVDTGRVEEVVFSEDRREDLFLVEDGMVVTGDRNRRTLPQAGRDAVPIQVFRSGSDALGLPVGPHLCLDEGGCPELRWLAAGASNGSLTISALDAATHPQLAAIFDPDVWRIEGRWVMAPEGVSTVDRLPAPLGDVAWVIGVG